MTTEFEQLLRRYAVGGISGRTIRDQGHTHVDILAGLGELGLRPPIARLDGPNGEALRRGVAVLTHAIAEKMAIQNNQIHGPYRILIVQRAEQDGNGWRLHCYEDTPGQGEVEVHRALYPFTSECPYPHDEAVRDGECWLKGQPEPDRRDAEHYARVAVIRDQGAKVEC